MASLHHLQQLVATTMAPNNNLLTTTAASRSTRQRATTPMRAHTPTTNPCPRQYWCVVTCSIVINLYHTHNNHCLMSKRCSLQHCRKHALGDLSTVQISTPVFAGVTRRKLDCQRGAFSVYLQASGCVCV